MSDLISRQTAIDAVDKLSDEPIGYLEAAIDALVDLPSAQPDAIPLEWIAKHLEWLDNCDNDFAQLAKVAIRATVEIWKKEKT